MPNKWSRSFEPLSVNLKLSNSVTSTIYIYYEHIWNKQNPIVILQIALDTSLPYLLHSEFEYCMEEVLAIGEHFIVIILSLLFLLT